MNNLDITLLTESQLFSSKSLEVFNIYGRRAAPTDFAILLGAYVSDEFHTSEGKDLEHRICWYWTKNVNYYDSAVVVDDYGHNGYAKVIKRTGGARLVLPYSSIESYCTNKKTNLRVEIVEFGEYPQTIVRNKLSDEIERRYNNDSLVSTGKTYTTDSIYWQDYDKEFNPRTFTEYEYKGNKYIRFVADDNCKGNTASNGIQFEFGKTYWIKVEPIEWLVDEETDLAVTKKLLFSGVQFKHSGKYNGDFYDTDIKRFIDNYFSKEIVCKNDKKFIDNYSSSMDEEIKKIKEKSKEQLDEFYKQVEKELLQKLFGDNISKLNELSIEAYNKALSELNKKLETYKKEQLDEFNKQIELIKKEIENKEKELRSTIESKESVFNFAKEKIDEITAKNIESLSKRGEEVLKSQIAELERVKNELMIELSNLIRDNFIKLQEEFDKLTGRVNAEIQKLEKKERELRNISKEADKELERIERKRSSLEQSITDSVIRKVAELNPVKEVSITIDDVKKKGIKGLFHQDFEAILQLVSLRMPIFLVGPAGCGKNVVLKQCAEVLDKKFYYQNDADEDHKLLGFVDANGIYHKTPFYNAFCEGGILMLDEMDNSNASVLLKLNSAIGSGNDFYMTFPNGETRQAHKDFQVVAAANTYGTGSNQVYCGRNQIDGATLDRYFVYNLDYDRELEKALVQNKDILELFWQVRDIVKENDIRHTVSTRAILNMDKIISSRIIGKGTFTIGNAFDGTLIKGLDVEDLGVIVSRLSTNDKYTAMFLKHLKEKYSVDKDAYKNNNVNEESYSYTGRGYGSYGNW